MTDAVLWSIFSSVFAGLVLLALKLFLENAAFRSTIKSMQKELDTARSEIAALSQRYDEQVKATKESYDVRVEELTKTLSNLQSSVPPCGLSSPPLEEEDSYKRIRQWKKNLLRP